jgi:hypothetical protein
MHLMWVTVELKWKIKRNRSGGYCPRGRFICNPSHGKLTSAASFAPASPPPPG